MTCRAQGGPTPASYGGPPRHLRGAKSATAETRRCLARRSVGGSRSPMAGAENLFACARRRRATETMGDYSGHGRERQSLNIVGGYDLPRFLVLSVQGAPLARRRDG